MWLRLRQVALLAKDIEAVVDDLNAVFGLKVAFIDDHLPDAYGLQNRLLPVDNQFIEICSPIREGTAGGRYLQRRGGDSGYMVITQADDHAPRKARVKELGIRVVAQRDTDTYCLMQLHPQDTGGSFLEIDWHVGADDPVPGWSHAIGADWRPFVNTDLVSAITAVEIQSADPGRLAARWSEIIQAPSTAAKAATSTSPSTTPPSASSPPPTAARRPAGMDLRASNADEVYQRARERGLLREDGVVMISGTRFRLCDPLRSGCCERPASKPRA
jgi:hypothetical protein